ncbi:hypothetical protein PBCVKS1B_475L [Paramecium bursaria Chlorella virus KS1B]|nr:hypothetical protein PBCVKS1B_475L [Paramecium bursaria Chlorella virus KS1B]
METVKMAYVYAKSIYHNFMTNKNKHYKCLIFNEEGSEFDFIGYASITTIEEIKQILRYKKYKLEIRYKDNGKKYRIVVRENENVHLPIRKNPGLVKPTITFASLVKKDTKEEYDVTERVLKYFGPNNDFNTGLGLKLFVQDMFPVDNHKENAKKFSALRICMSNGNDYYFDYEYNQEIGDIVKW